MFDSVPLAATRRKVANRNGYSGLVSESW
jgi:hypothetical protein